MRGLLPGPVAKADEQYPQLSACQRQGGAGKLKGEEPWRPVHDGLMPASLTLTQKPSDGDLFVNHSYELLLGCETTHILCRVEEALCREPYIFMRIKLMVTVQFLMAHLSPVEASQERA